MTREEKHLWYDFLRDFPVRFVRQKVIGHYIADFYCAKARLVVEVDGGHHFTVVGLSREPVHTGNAKQQVLPEVAFQDKKFLSRCFFKTRSRSK